MVLSWDSGYDGNAPITEYIISFETNWPDLGWQVLETVPASSTQASLNLFPWNTVLVIYALNYLLFCWQFFLFVNILIR